MDRLTEFVMGRHAVKEALFSGSVKEIFQIKGLEKEEDLLRQAKSRGIKITFVSKDYLKKQLKSDSHQGIAARIKRFFFYDVLEFIEKTGKNTPLLYVALDSIYDPHNFGAILRACECFGANGLIFSKNRGVDVTPSVSKASVGASEILPLLKVSNLVETLKKFREEGFEIITSEIDSEAKSLENFEFKDKCVLVFGSEGEGVRDLVSRLADKKVYIPMFGKIDSLNVSQAASVLLAFWRFQAGGFKK